MCGIAGIVGYGPGNGWCQREQLGRMLSKLTHRGPDDQGIWIDGPVALGHRRLSIVDLSPMGHQPMRSATGRYTIVFNGEIYNHGELRERLRKRAVSFRGQSDTEVLLALIEQQGLVEALNQSVGMFAFALWDTFENVLHLARDRFGEKPLYFGYGVGAFCFASELKTLQAVTGFSPAIDPASVLSVLQRGFVAPTRSILASTRQVSPGTFISFSAECLRQESRPGLVVTRFWNPSQLLDIACEKPFGGSFGDAVDELESLLRRAVGLQLQADVPVGALLSGGVDSSIVTALMCAQAPKRVRSYSIGFRDKAFDEAQHAKAVAAHLGTAHTEWYVDEAEAMNLVPTLWSIYDEPLADASQIPTLILARLVRRDVTVALSGDGADELFGGYPKYARGLKIWSARERRVVHALSSFAHTRLVEPLQEWLPASLSRSIPWHRFHTAASVTGSASMAEMADRVGMLNHRAEEFMSPRLLSQALDSVPPNPFERVLSYRRTAMLADVQSYLPGDILTKVDRATMAASLESRAPFLDHRIFEFAATLPESYLFDAGGGKAVLREVLYRLVPRELVDRPKSGFQAPLGAWLRGGLKDWAYDLLGSAAVAEVLAVDRSRALLDRHNEGLHDLSARIWPILSIAAWAQKRQELAV
jgi:asparagine synthase (glutamine-hydrolysing)